MPRAPRAALPGEKAAAPPPLPPAPAPPRRQNFAVNAAEAQVGPRAWPYLRWPAHDAAAHAAFLARLSAPPV